MTRVGGVQGSLAAVLATADDPLGAAPILAAYVMDPSREGRAALERAGMSAVQADLAARRPGARDVPRDCYVAAGWILGVRTARPAVEWWPVVTAPRSSIQSASRYTAESLVGLIASASRRLRLFSPFMDVGGMRLLRDALSLATARRVHVWIGHREAAGPRAAIKSLSEGVERAGGTEFLHVVGVNPDVGFPHLKLLTVDGIRAYMGSANMTYAALTGNLEMGALVEGPGVAAFDEALDLLFTQSSGVDAAGGEPAKNLGQ